MKIRALLAVLMCLACLGSGAKAAVSTPSDSKLSIHLIDKYTSGAVSIVQAHPRVLKILGVGSTMLAAGRDFKASTPGGIVVCRIYTTKHYSVTDNPAASGQDFWNSVLAPPLNSLSASDRALIDYVEGPNESDSTPTWNTLADARWYNTFWLTLAPLIAQAGFRPCAFSISAGCPPGSPSTVRQMLDCIVPALRLCQALGGAWSYHPYTIPYTQDITKEIWYSLRYRQYYQYFDGKYPDLVSLPLIFTEGGVDGQSKPTGPGWLDQGAVKYESWLQWWDRQIRQDPYVIGCTLFEIGNPGSWQTFDLEPVSGWLANYLSTQRGSVSPSIMITPLSLFTTTITGASPDSQAFTIRNSGGGTLNYFVSGLPNWLRVTPASGTSTGDIHTLTVSYSSASLSPGVYNANITVSDSNASNSPQKVPVTLTVNPFINAMADGTNLGLSATRVLTDFQSVVRHSRRQSHRRHLEHEQRVDQRQWNPAVLAGAGSGDRPDRGPMKRWRTTASRQT